MITKERISQQKAAIEDLYKLVQDAPDSDRKTTAIAYCESCIAACDLGAKVLASQSKTAKKEEKAEDAATEEVTAKELVKEEKPKRKRTTKKKEEPIIEEVAEDDDLDDLL